MPEKAWDPEKYDEQSVLQYRTAMQMLETFPFTGDEHVLDVGSGSGKISDTLAQRVLNGRVVGADRNHDMIEFAQRKYKKSNLSFVETDVSPQ
jgi:ubiquinone/menaquinone biosynthesis C-methylase UbiE